MLANAKDKLGRYRIDLGNSEKEKKMGRAWFQHRIDHPSELRVTLIERPAKLAAWQLGDLPQEAQFSWQSKGLFKGYLAEVLRRSPTRLDLVYRDALFLARKRSQHQFVKQQTLQQCLRKMVSGLGMQAQFFGDFAGPLPGMRQNGSDIFSLLHNLGEQHGFFTVSRPFASQIAFLRPGEAIGECAHSPQTVSHLQTTRSAHSSYQRVHTRYFDSKTTAPLEGVLTSNALYASLNPFTRESGFRTKMTWKTAEGEAETLATDRHHFDSAEKVLSSQLSKQLLQQEMLELTCFEPIGVVGEKIHLSKFSTLEDGTYLISHCTIDILSALPRMVLIAIRP